MSETGQVPFWRDLVRTMLRIAGLVALMSAAAAGGFYHKYLQGFYYGARLAMGARQGRPVAVGYSRLMADGWGRWWDKLYGLGPAGVLGNRLAFSVGAKPGSPGEQDLAFLLASSMDRNGRLPSGARVILVDNAPPAIPSGAEFGSCDKVCLRYRLGRYDVAVFRHWMWARGERYYSLRPLMEVDCVENDGSRRNMVEKRSLGWRGGLFCKYDPAQGGLNDL